MVIRQSNWLGQERIDVPLLRAQESSVAGDFDVLVGNIMSGRQALIVSGFKLTNIGVGAPVTSIQCIVAGGSLINFNASESGSFFQVPSDRAPETISSGGLNPNVTGSWTANATNFLGVDLIRSADSSTADTLQFLNAQTLSEIPKTVPLGRTLNYRFVISTTDFSAQPNLCPIAQIVTNTSNNIVSATDCRNLLGRVAPGGDFPNIYQGYGWPGGRAENLTGDIFSNGDKAIGSLREWMQAASTRIWEIGGGEFWYSATADRNVTMIWTGSTFSDGENFEWDGTNLHWKGLKFIFDNSTGFYNDVINQTSNSPGLTDLVDGQCIYVDLDRTQNRVTGINALQAVKANLTTLGPGTVPGSRQIIAWNIAGSIYTRNWRYAVGTTFIPATATSLGVVKLSRNDSTPSQPVVISDAGGTIVAPAGASATGLQATGGTPNGIGITGIGVGVGVGVEGLVTGANGTAFAGFGNGSGAGGSFIGGSSGQGVIGVGGTTGPGGQFSNGGANPGTAGAVFANEGLISIGSGSGDGVAGFGGASSGTGVFGKGGATGGFGVSGLGVGSGYGGTFTGGATDGTYGVSGTSAATNGNGGRFTATGTGNGVDAFGGSGNGVGVVGTGGSNNGNGGIFIASGASQGTNGDSTKTGVAGVGCGNGDGVGGFGGALNGTGVFGKGGATNGIGVVGTGAGTGAGGSFTGGTNGAGVSAIAGGGTNRGITALGFGSGIGSEGGGFGAGTGTVSGTPQNAIIATNGNIAFGVGVANPGNTDTFKNTLTPRNMLKASIHFTSNNTAAPTLDESFNVASFSVTNATPSIVTVTFNNNFASAAGYCVAFGFDGVNSPYIAQNVTKAAGSITFEVFAGVTGINLTTVTGPAVSFMAFGSQA